MDDEQSGLSTFGANVGLPDETHVENVGGENQIDESYEIRDDGGEIMVEIVGTDVFVDGVSSNEKEDDFFSEGFDSHVLENREENDTADFPGFNAFTNVGDRGRLLESELEVTFTESVSVTEMSSLEVNVSNVEMVNPEFQEMTVTTTETIQSTITRTEEVTERSSEVVSEEMVTEDANLDDKSASENQAAEPSVARGIGGAVPVVVTDEKETNGKEFDDSENLVTPFIEGEIGSGAVVIVESAIKDDGAVNNNSSSASPEHLIDPVEALIAEETVTSSARHDLCSLEDSRAADAGQIMPNEVSPNPDCEFLEEVGLVEENAFVRVDHNQIDPSPSVTMNCTASASGTVDPICDSEKILTAGIYEGGVSCTNDESDSPIGDCVIDAKLGHASESKDLSIEGDGPQSDLKDENLKYDATDRIDNASHGQYFVIEREEAMDVDFDVVLDFKDVEFNPPGTSNNEILENVGDFGIDDFASDPTDIDDTAEPNLGKGSKNDLQAGADENMVHKNTGEKELLEADPGTYIGQPVIDTPMTEVTNDQNTGTSQEKVMDANEPSKNCEGLYAECTENNVAGNNVNAEIELDNLVEERESHQIEEVEVSLQETETVNDGIGMLENISLLPNNVNGATVCSNSNHVNTSSMNTGSVELASSNDETKQSRESDDNSGKSGNDHVVEDRPSEIDVKHETEPDQEYREEEEINEPSYEIDTTKLITKDQMRSSGDLRMSQSGYLSENDGNFAVSDLVWGKVKSHPWWPGQIFNHEDASKKAMKHYKKDSYLVAYFGDRTFAWNDASFLKPFRSQFSQTVKQSTSEMFQNAVDCALEEVSRRVELGLSCSCTPENAFGEIATQIVDNSGIREDSSRRNGIDQSCKATNFEPGEFLQYVRDLAPRACSGADRLDIVIAQAQVSAFCRFKGYRVQTEFPSAGELLENDAAIEELSAGVVYSRKSKRVPKENLLDDFEYSPDDEDEAIASLYPSRKRKAVDSLADGPSGKKVNFNSAKKSNEYPKPSFKIGECIRRVASQLTAAVVKSTTDELGNNGLINEHSEEPSSLIEMLSQLELLAQNPNKQYSFKDQIVTFFKGFRSSIVVNKRGGRKRKANKMAGVSAEEFEFDDVSDSYWTDRIVQNYSEKQLLHENENGAGEEPVARFDGGEKTVKSGGRKPNSRRKFFRSSHPNMTVEVDEKVKRLKQEASPAELILNFSERKFIPSEINLNKTFRRFGALMESETEVDHESGRARVIFKRGSDAEVARNSAQSFNIFGPVLVNYQIGYSPLISVKISNIALPQVQEDGALML